MFEDRTKPRTEIKDLGEFGLIDYITGDIELTHESSEYGVGDDAAVINPQAKRVLVSTDMLMEGIHFDLTYAPLKHLGYKAAVVNFSDIAAMNAIPTQITVSMALSNRFSLEAVEEFYKGLKLACKAYNVDIVGGDTTSSKAGLAISITVIGLIDEQDIVYRNGAKEGDLICVSGDLGAAYAGLLTLEREKSVFAANPDMQPELEGSDYVLERQLKPEARVDIIKILKDSDIKPNAMIDVSDGLASEVKHICKQSKLGAAIYEDKLPIDQKTWDAARAFNMDPTMFALNGGDDYELLFTVPQSDFEKLKDIPEVSIIGYTTDKESGINLITKNNVSAPMEAQGWDGFDIKVGN